MITVEVSSPLRGAAYQILFQRVAPSFCTTRERQAEIKATLGAVIGWATAQNASTRDAYIWAAGLILEQIEAQLKSTELSRACAVAMETIARPPT